MSLDRKQRVLTKARVFVFEFQFFSERGLALNVKIVGVFWSNNSETLVELQIIRETV